MNNFSVIYRILKYLESTLDTGEVDRKVFNSKTFGVSENRFYPLEDKNQGNDLQMKIVLLINTLNRGGAERICVNLANRFAESPFESLPDAVVEMTAVWKLVLKNLTGKSNPPCQDAAR